MIGPPRASVFLSVMVALFAGASHAKLEPVSFDELIAASDLIVLARPKSIIIDDLVYGAGRATFHVDGVLRGDFAVKEVSLSWTSGAHDQRVREVDAQLILFLKRGAGQGFKAAVYGRAFFHLRPTMLVEAGVPASVVRRPTTGDDGEKLLFTKTVHVDEFPMDVIELPPGLVHTVTEWRGGREPRTVTFDVAFADELVSYIANRSPTRRDVFSSSP